MRAVFKLTLAFARPERRGGGVPTIARWAVGYALADVKEGGGNMGVRRRQPHALMRAPAWT